MIREASKKDLDDLLELYLELHEVSIPQKDEALLNTWNKILQNEDYHLLVAKEDGKIVSSCTCLVVPNLTRQGASYVLVENVVTKEAYRGKGFATACLKEAERIAVENGCYKLMLITGSHDPKTHELYRKAGYSSEGKTAYYHLLKEVNWAK